MGWIIAVAFGILVWAAVGHALWLIMTLPFSSRQQKPCKKCKQTIGIEDKACRFCGWSSVPVDLQQSILICHQALNAALSRGLIDQEMMKRGSEILENLKKPAIDPPKTGSVPSLPPDMIVTQTPSQFPSVPKSHAPQKQQLEVARTSVVATPPAEAVPVVAVPKAPEAHALDREYEPARPAVAPKKEPTRTWSQLLSAFMEESNIRWGELIGGLLIVCCSTALVISFWENIASRPWLKFSVFTGINASIFGLGLYAWHRWKLPMTSKGILVIGMMQLPLNFLAFALFTMGKPWDWTTVAGEVVSMAILGYLAYLAAKILTPTTVGLSACTPVIFGLANLLIRRTVDQGASDPLLYAWALGLFALYTLAIAMSRRPLIEESQGRFGPALAFFAIATFGLLLSSGLLLRCSGHPVDTFRNLSPMLALFAAPALLMSLDIGKRIEKQSNLTVPMILLGTLAIAMSGIGLLFSWPAPALMVSTGLGLLVLIAVAAIVLTNSRFVDPASLIVSFLVVLAFYGFTGKIDWMNHSSETLVKVLATPDTGFIWVGYSVCCALVSLLLTRLNKPTGALAILRSAAVSGVLGTIVLTAFGFGREAYSASLGSIYGLYAISAFALGTVRRKPSLEVVGIVFLLAAAFQWVVIGRSDFDGLTRMYAFFFAVSVCLLVFMMIRNAFGYTAHQEQPSSIAATASLVAISLIALFFISENQPAFSSNRLTAATLLWFVFAWLQQQRIFWQITQGVGIASVLSRVVQTCMLADWWLDEPSLLARAFFHPTFLQYVALALLVCGILLVLLHELLRRNWGSISDKLVGALKDMHDSSVARVAIASGTILTLGVMVYGAVPGVTQELIPRNASMDSELISYVQAGATLERYVPKLESLELAGIPHAAASWGRESNGYRVWGLPPITAAWAMSLCALLALCWNLVQTKDRAWRNCAGLFAATGISLWYPLASLAEPGVASASALRWLTAGAFFLVCLGLSFWILRVNREQEPAASGRFALFDRLFSTFSIHTFVPWMAMGIVVVVSVLSRAKPIPGGWLIWVITIAMAFVAMAVMFLPRMIEQQNSPRPALSITSIVASTLLVSPLIAWVLLEIAMTVVSNPLTGPNPDTLFAQLGLAGSYAVPILLVAIGLISVAASRPSPNVAFVAALFLMVSVVAGYMLILKSNGVYVQSWIGLCAILSATASIYSLVWQFFTSRDTRSDALLHWNGRPAAQVRSDWQASLSQISAGFATVGLVLIVGIVLVAGPSTSGLVWGSSGILASIAFHFSQAYKRDSKIEFGPWIAAAGAAGMGIVAPNFSATAESLGASGIVILAAGLVVVLNSIRNALVEGSRGQANSRYALWSVLAIATCISLRNLLNLPRIPGAVWSQNAWSVGILIGAWVLAAANTWFHSDRWSWIWSLLLGQLAGLIYSNGFMFNGGPNGSTVSGAMLLQIAIMAGSSAFATLSGFGRKSRIPLLLGTLVVFFISAVWLIGALSIGGTTRAVLPYDWFALAIGACLFGGVTGFWNSRSRDEHGVIYLSGLSGAVLLLQSLGSNSAILFWATTIVLGAYCLGTSFLWRAGGRLQDELSSLLRIPKVADKPPSLLIVPMNTALAIGVAVLGVIAQFTQEASNFRLLSANAIMAVAFAVGFLARYASFRIFGNRDSLPTTMRVLALMIGVLYAIALFWHIQPLSSSGIQRLGVSSLPLLLTAGVYGFGLIKWFGGKEEWEWAGSIVVPWLVGLSILVGVLFVGIEFQLHLVNRSIPFDAYTVICMILSLLIAGGLCLAAALLPGRDPLGLSERGREVYVYAAQAILVLMIVHLRISLPFLFAGWLQSIWPLLAVAIGFSGIAFAEWSQRRGLHVLANPLRNSGSLLPLLPIIGSWAVPSSIDNGVTLFASAIGYGLFGYLRTSPGFITTSIVCANVAFWQILQRNDFSFAQHPQLWVIPPALCVFTAGQIFKQRLTTQQLAMIRYLSIGSIYVASTSEIFLQGIAKAPWLPIVLAILSVLGILFGIAARIRSMLWLGSMFLSVAMFSILWYAAVDLDQTWLWYVCGIVLGATMLFVFAMFEKRRENLKRIMSDMQSWEE